METIGNIVVCIMRDKSTVNSRKLEHQYPKSLIQKRNPAPIPLNPCSSFLGFPIAPEKIAAKLQPWISKSSLVHRP